MLIDCKMTDVHARSQASMLVEEASKDEDEDEEEKLVEDVTRLFVITMDR